MKTALKRQSTRDQFQSSEPPELRARAAARPPKLRHGSGGTSVGIAASHSLVGEPTLHYPKGRSLAVTFNCSLQTAMGYKQGFVQSGEFTEDQITVEAVESESGGSPTDD